MLEILECTLENLKALGMLDAVGYSHLKWAPGGSMRVGFSFPEMWEILIQRKLPYFLVPS